MTRDVISVEKDVSLKRGAELMARNAISGTLLLRRTKRLGAAIMLAGRTFDEQYPKDTEIP